MFLSFPKFGQRFGSAFPAETPSPIRRTTPSRVLSVPSLRQPPKRSFATPRPFSKRYANFGNDRPIESAVETLPPREQRELFDFLATKLESESAGAVIFPDLKALLLAMPDSGEEADFTRVREYPRDMDLS